MVVSAAMVGLQGCVVGPNYQQLDLEPPKQFYQQPVLSALGNKADDAPADQSWWYGFSDPTLKALIERGLRGSYIVKKADAEHQAARALAEAAIASHRTKVTATGDGMVSARHGLNRSRQTVRYRSADAGISATRSIDLFGEKQRVEELARAQSSQAQARLMRASNSVAAQIAKTYLKYRGYQEKQQILKAAIDRQKATHAEVERRYQKGSAPEYDLLRSKIAVQRLVGEIPTLEADALKAQFELEAILGLYSGDLTAELTGYSPVPDYSWGTPGFSPASLVVTRPDVVEAEEKLKAAVAEVGLARVSRYPSFNVKADMGLIHSISTGLAVGNAMTGAVGGAIDYALFTSGERDAKIEAAKARQRAAEATYRETFRGAVGEVEVQLTDLAASKQKMMHLKAIQATSKDAFEIAQELYRSREVGFLSVTTSQKAMYNIERDVVDERVQQGIHFLDLCLALGGQSSFGISIGSDK